MVVALAAAAATVGPVPNPPPAADRSLPRASTPNRALDLAVGKAAAVGDAEGSKGETASTGWPE
jgi:hypothetical protein